jgi:glycosyltransferase involved in cell wall biosynthesis
MAEDLLLHPELFEGVLRGQRMAELLRASVQQSANEITAMPGDHPDVSVVIRTRNNESQLPGLLHDIYDSQKAFGGEVQLIIADSASTDWTRLVAQSLGSQVSREVKIVPVDQENFSYPAGLNTAFEAADNPFILSVVGHERLATRRTFDPAVRMAHAPEIGGSFGPCLPNAQATMSERVGAVFLRTLSMLKKPKRITEAELGILASDRAIIRTDVWEYYQYDKDYGAGGEDGALAQAMLRDGLRIWREPVLTMHHTHGLGPVKSLQQVAEWRRISKGPHPFDRSKYESLRPGQS